MPVTIWFVCLSCFSFACFPAFFRNEQLVLITIEVASNGQCHSNFIFCHKKKECIVFQDCSLSSHVYKRRHLFMQPCIWVCSISFASVGVTYVLCSRAAVVLSNGCPTIVFRQTMRWHLRAFIFIWASLGLVAQCSDLPLRFSSSRNKTFDSLAVSVRARDSQMCNFFE